MKTLMTVGTAAASALFAFAGMAEVTYTWNAQDPQTSFGDGDVTLTLDANDKITSMTSVLGGDDIVFTGDPMTFAAGAVHSASYRDVRFENDVVAEGAISFAAIGDGVFTYDGGPVAPEGTTVIFENMTGDLSDYEIVKSVLCGAAGGEAKPYFVERTEDGMTAQLHQEGSTSTKCVKIRLTKSGANILIELVYARYVMDATQVGKKNFDFEPYESMKLGTDLVSSGSYGLVGLTVRRTAKDRVTFAGTFTEGGSVAIANTVDVTLEDPGRKVFRAPFAGAGNVTVRAVTDPHSPEKQTFTVTTDTLPATSWLNWSVLAENALLSDVTAEDLSAQIGGSSYGTTDPIACKGKVCLFVNDGITASCQFQGMPGSLKGAKISFRQNGDNIEMKADWARYILSSNNPKPFLGEDLSPENTRSLPYGYSLSQVCLTSLSLSVKTANPTVVTMPDGIENTWAGGTLTIEGNSVAPATYYAYSRTAWPSNGVVEVLAGGTLVMTNFDSTGGCNFSIANGTSPIYVHPGGTFIQRGITQFDFALHKNQRLIVDGGEAWFGYGATSEHSSSDPVDTAGSTYLGYLTLSNGARCRGKAVRAGFSTPEPVFSAVGGSVSYFDVGISFVGNTTGVAHFTFNADEDSELVVNGDVLPFQKNAGRKLQVFKTGKGIVRFNGTINFGNVTEEYNVQPETRVQEGEIVFGKSACANADLAFSLEGGGLAAAEGTANSVGETKVSGVSTIRLEDGSSLSFPDLSGTEWAAGSRLNVTGDLKASRLRFGTSASGLTAAQLRMIRVNGNQRAQLDENGYLEGFVPGIMMIVR